MRNAPSVSTYIKLQLIAGYAGIAAFITLVLGFRPHAVRPPTTGDTLFFAVPIAVSYLLITWSTSKLRRWVFRSKFWPLVILAITSLSIGVSSGIALCFFWRGSIARDPSEIIQILLISGPATIGAAPAGLFSTTLFFLHLRKQGREAEGLGSQTSTVSSGTPRPKSG